MGLCECAEYPMEKSEMVNYSMDLQEVLVEHLMKVHVVL